MKEKDIRESIGSNAIQTLLSPTTGAGSLTTTDIQEAKLFQGKCQYRPQILAHNKPWLS
jgi:hypothetical protein